MISKIVNDFAKAINDHDVNKIYSLMADEHKFVDAHGNEITGKENMKVGWSMYFQWFPDYKIEITELFENENLVAAFGYASGTYHGINSAKNYWRIPAAWQAVVKENKIATWKVYADTKIPFDILERNK